MRTLMIGILMGSASLSPAVAQRTMSGRQTDGRSMNGQSGMGSSTLSSSSRWGGSVGGHWAGGMSAPGGWHAYHRLNRGSALPHYWVAPRFYISDYTRYGLSQPGYGYSWSRYYDDAVLIDQRGRVWDSVGNVDWDDVRGSEGEHYADRGDERREYRGDRRHDRYDRHDDDRGGDDHGAYHWRGDDRGGDRDDMGATGEGGYTARSVVTGGGYASGGYYYPPVTTTVVTIQTAPLITTTTREYVTYTARRVVHARHVWHPVRRCGCR